jgi:PAS domain S-box-containing protein
MGNADGEIGLRAFLMTEEGRFGVAGQLFGSAVGILWTPKDSTSLVPVAGWSGESVSAASVPKNLRESVVKKGSGLPGRAWATGQIAWPTSEEGRVAVPVPIGPPEQVEVVIEILGEVEIEAEDAGGVLADFAGQLFSLLRGTRPDPATERLHQHMAEVVRGSQDAVLSKDLDGIVTSWNPAAEQMYGYSAAEAIGRHISFIVPADHKDEEKRILERVYRGERLKTYETERIRKDGVRISVSLTVSPIRTPGGELVGASVIARDITAEKRSRSAEAFLVAASRKLDVSLDSVETARTIVSTAVPDLAEVCVIDFLRTDGWLGDSVVAGVDTEAAAALEELRRKAPLDPNGEHPVAQVLRSGLPTNWRDLGAPGVVDQAAQSEEHRRHIDVAGYRSAAAVPLVARDRTLGILSFLYTSSDLRYDPEDLAFLSELGDRAAMALDNAKLFEEKSRIAQDLQRGLRPPSPPPVPGLELSVVFEAAGQGSEIGGDFYDVIPIEDGCWLLIGDVAGKGSAAAGVSVAVRHTVRSLCREIPDPDRVLARVNELLHEGESLHDFATAQLIRMQRDASGWTLKLASAGHPPAVHVSPEETRQLGGGSLLGAWTPPVIDCHEASLGDDESLVLTTDGWFEVGPVAKHRHPESLATHIAALAEIALPELTDRLRADAVARSQGALEDDMVILAVRPGAEDPAAGTAQEPGVVASSGADREGSPDGPKR